MSEDIIELRGHTYNGHGDRDLRVPVSNIMAFEDESYGGDKRAQTIVTLKNHQRIVVTPSCTDKLIEQIGGDLDNYMGLTKLHSNQRLYLRPEVVGAFEVISGQIPNTSIHTSGGDFYVHHAISDVEAEYKAAKQALRSTAMHDLDIRPKVPEAKRTRPLLSELKA